MKSGTIVFILVFMLFFAVGAFGQSDSNSSTDEAPYALEDVTLQKFTGDLDAMVQRRIIRVLVPYSKTHYFVDKATQRGLTYDVFQLFEDKLNKSLNKKHIRVNVVFVPVARDELIPALVGGRGDIAAANLTITPERMSLVDFTNPTLRNVSEIIVTGPGAEPISTLEDLSGREVYIRKSSSYYESIEKLNIDLTKAGKKPVAVRLAPETLETEDILEMVNAGLVKITIVDNHIAEFWKKIFNGISLHPDIAVRTSGAIGVMIRKDSPQVKAKLNEFFASYPEGSKTRNILLQKYLKNTKYVESVTSKERIERFHATIEFFRKYGDKYNLDYLLLAAQGFQESRLDQSARNPSGAIGVMQVLPSTGKDMKIGDITKLEDNIHAGVKYIRFIMDRYYAGESMDTLNKGLFTFASYNAGPGRVSQLRKATAKRGLNPNKWFNNVEILAAEKIGRETVQYVSNIYKYYLAYKMIVEIDQKRDKSKIKEIKEL
jgi:membrane-bound lytic murein transglycosylase MltF